MLKTDFTHRRSALMSAEKKTLVDHIMLLEHNYKAMQISLEQQAENIKKLYGDMKTKEDIEREIQFILSQEKLIQDNTIRRELKEKRQQLKWVLGWYDHEE